MLLPWSQTAYPPGVTMGVGFRALLRTLLAKLDLIFIDPLDPTIRKIGGASAGGGALVGASAPQGRPFPNAILSCLQPATTHRVHIEPKFFAFFCWKMVSACRFAARIPNTPWRPARLEISPNALLRPVFEDYLLPTLAYIGGPGELAYLAQSQVIYDRLLGRMPVVMSRSGFTLLDARSAKLLERYCLTAAQTLVPEESFERASTARALVPERIESRLRPPPSKSPASSTGCAYLTWRPR